MPAGMLGRGPAAETGAAGVLLAGPAGFIGDPPGVPAAGMAGIPNGPDSICKREDGCQATDFVLQ